MTFINICWYNYFFRTSESIISFSKEENGCCDGLAGSRMSFKHIFRPSRTISKIFLSVVVSFHFGRKFSILPASKESTKCCKLSEISLT